MDTRIIVDKITSTVVAAISGYVAVDQGFTFQGLLGAFGTMLIASSIGYYIYKDSIANARMKHAQAREIELKNELTLIHIATEKRKFDGYTES